MPSSEARIRANQANAQRSTGPKTPEGKERSRANSYKHGLTGDGIVLSNEDAAEISRRLLAFESDLQPSCEVGRTLVRRVALLSLRMDRGVVQESAALNRRIQKAEADFVAPAGLDALAVARLRAEAGRESMFDPSKEACLARKYEAAAERGFFRALKELRLLAKQDSGSRTGFDARMLEETMGSFSDWKNNHPELVTLFPEAALDTPDRFGSAPMPPLGGSNYVPITIGRRG